MPHYPSEPQEPVTVYDVLPDREQIHECPECGDDVEGDGHWDRDEDGKDVYEVWWTCRCGWAEYCGWTPTATRREV